MAYATIADVRAEGVPTPPAVGGKSDAQIQAALDRATLQIEAWTGRFFEPRDLTLILDGSGGRAMLLGHPIVSVDSLRIIGRDLVSTTAEIDLDDVRIYNRHMSGLLDPDDRDNPRIELTALDEREEFMPAFSELRAFDLDRWPRGTQNIEVEGSFGYTEADESTPLLISRACVLMALRDLEPRYGAGSDDSFDRRNAHRLTMLRTRDQTIQWASPEKFGVAGIGGFTGDPEIDGIILRYTRPMKLGAA